MDQPQMGLSTPPPAQSPPPDQSLGLASPPAQNGGAGDYGKLWGDFSNYYLQNGGNQAGLDAYSAGNPGQDYNTLANQASQWYTDPTRNGNLRTMDAGGGIGPDKVPGRTQDVANYFGLPPMGNGMQYSFQSGGNTFPAPQPTMSGPPQGGSTPPPTGGPVQGGGGTPPGGTGTPPPTNNGTSPQQGSTPPTSVAQGPPPGSRGTLLGAIGQNPMLWGPPVGGQTYAGANLGGINNAPNLGGIQADNAAYGPGSGTIYDPWNQPSVGPHGEMPLGYARGATTQTPLMNGAQPITGAGGKPVTQQTGGDLIKWDQPQGPTGGYTQTGQNQMSQPFQAGGMSFPNLQAFLEFMMKSTPQEQALKTQMEGVPEPGGGTLFSALAPYLGTNTTQPPTGATPFTNWNPTGLLDLLMKSGLLK